MRVYVPLLVTELAGVVGSGRLPERSVLGVTSALRSADPTADEEDLEFEAMCQALDAARSLGAGRRAVAAADVRPEAGAAPETVLGVDRAVPVSDIVSFHVEESEGSLGEGYDDLLWYDVTELSVLAELGG